MDAYRDPCPSRIVTDCGSAFAMGAIGGSLWHGVIMGWNKAPRGTRFSSAIAAIRARGPKLGGSFAVWGGLYSSFDCSFAYIRRKEDFYNSIMSGAATGAVLAARSGWMASLKSGAVGGSLLALIEGVVFVISRQAADQSYGNIPPPPPTEDVLDVPQEKEGIFSGMFDRFSSNQQQQQQQPAIDALEEEALREFEFHERKEEDSLDDILSSDAAWGSSQEKEGQYKW